MQDPLDAYVSVLLRARGEPDTAESHAVLLEKVNAAVDQALLEALPLKQLDELEAATAENRVNADMVERLLTSAGIDPSIIMNEALKDFRTTYLKGGEK